MFYINKCVESIALISEGGSGSSSAWYKYNYTSEQFVVKASKFLCNFIFLIILCQQIFKHFSLYISAVDEFFI